VNVSYIVCTSTVFVFSAVAKILHVPMNGLCIESLCLFTSLIVKLLPLLVGSSSDLVVLRRCKNSALKNPISRMGSFSVVD